MQADKSIILKGNVKNGPLCCRPYPVTEFATGKWLLAITSITFESSNALSTSCAITCNFTTSQKRTKRGEVKVYEMPLITFHLKTTVAAPRTLYRFSPIYFPMNSIGDELRISLVDIFEDNDDSLKFDCEVAIQILFKKI